MERKLSPTDKLVLIVKVASGVDKDNKPWNTLYFPRYKKSCKKIYEYFSESQLSKEPTNIDPFLLSVKAIEDLSNEFKSRDITWTVETIVKWIFDWERQVIKYRRFKKLGYGQNKQG